jgi:hypothetical protein
MRKVLGLLLLLSVVSAAWTRSWIGRKKWWEMTVVMHREISAELQVLVRKGNQPIGG